MPRTKSISFQLSADLFLKLQNENQFKYNNGVYLLGFLIKKILYLFLANKNVSKLRKRGFQFRTINVFKTYCDFVLKYTGNSYHNYIIIIQTERKNKKKKVAYNFFFNASPLDTIKILENFKRVPRKDHQYKCLVS